MKKLSTTELAAIIDASLSMQHATLHATAVSTNSRTTKPGDCFFAIPGENFDGHDYLADAFQKGAVCAIVAKDINPVLFPGKALLKVPDTVKALGLLAAEYRRRCNFKVVALTGSVGKTTTRHFIYHVLSKHFKCSQAPKNFNNEIGLPLSLLTADPDDEIVIVELGANHPGEIAYLSKIAAPDIALITNVRPAHLHGFGSLEIITAEKLAISRGLRKDSSLFINADCTQLLDAAKKLHRPFLTFGQSDTADCRAKNLKSDGLTASLTIDGTEIHVPLPGLAYAQNALAAWAICKHLGLTLDDFASALKTLPPVPMRTELLSIATLTVINDCYNANPASMKNALDILAKFARSQKRRAVFICGDMAELGQYAERLHAELGMDIANKKIDALLTVGKLAKITAQSASKNAAHNFHTNSFEDTHSLCNNLHQFIKDSDIILVKGSRIAELERAVEKLTKIFASAASRLPRSETRETRDERQDTK